MPKYNVTEIQTTETKKRSEFVYVEKATGDKIVKAPAGQGAPKQKEIIDGKIYTLVEIIRYLPAQGAKRTRKETPVTKEAITRTTEKGETAQTILVYADGSRVVAGGGRPRYTHKDTGAALTQIITVVGSTVKGKKGRAPINTETIEVSENPRTEYLYGDTVYPGTGQRGAPPKERDGKPLVKIIKYVVSKTPRKSAPVSEDDFVQPEKPFTMPVSKLIPKYPVGTLVQYDGRQYRVHSVPSSDYFLTIQNVQTGFVTSAEERKVQIV